MHPYIPLAESAALRKLSQQASVLIFSSFGSLSSTVISVLKKARNALMSDPSIAEETILITQITYRHSCASIKIDRDFYEVVLTSPAGRQTLLYGSSIKDFDGLRMWDLAVYLCSQIDTQLSNSPGSCSSKQKFLPSISFHSTPELSVG